MNLEGKSILVTGASKGIGEALARKLNAEGAKLILTARNPISSDLAEKHIHIQADLTNKSDIKVLLNKLENTKLDALINVAGVGVYKSLEDVSTEEFEYSLKLNLIVPFVLTKYLVKNIKDSELSLVMNIGSGTGVMPFKNRSSYCATKFGLRGLTLSLAEEYRGKKPNFCLITLGSTKTTFANKTIKEQEKKIAEGNAIFPVKWVAEKLVEIIKTDNRDVEYTLYPGDYGFGIWKKPE